MIIKAIKNHRFFLLTLVFLIAAVVSLEILARICPRTVADINYPNCTSLLIKHAPDKEIVFVKDRAGFLQQELGISDMETALSSQVIDVPRSELLGLNGIACFPYAFVADDLPEAARKYVATHEVIHLFGEINETKTNFRAGIRQPVGLIQTVFYSLYLNFKDKNPGGYPCTTGRVWMIFKGYFLNL